MLQTTQEKSNFAMPKPSRVFLCSKLHERRPVVNGLDGIDRSTDYDVAQMKRALFRKRIQTVSSASAIVVPLHHHQGRCRGVILVLQPVCQRDEGGHDNTDQDGWSDFIERVL